MKTHYTGPFSLNFSDDEYHRLQEVLSRPRSLQQTNLSGCRTVSERMKKTIIKIYTEKRANIETLARAFRVKTDLITVILEIAGVKKNPEGWRP